MSDLPARVEAAMQEYTRTAIEDLAAAAQRAAEQSKFLLRRVLAEIDQIAEDEAVVGQVLTEPQEGQQ